MESELIPQTLSLKLRHSTMREHKETEGSKFIKKLFQGTCSKKEYVNYLWSLQEIYEALETSLTENKNHPSVAPIYFPQLFRLNSLNEDLRIWSPNSAPEMPLAVKSAVRSYVDRITFLGKSNPALLTAHAYVRYLGDLSGGQSLGRIIIKQFPETQGIHFYQYSFSNYDEMKTLYRARLDEIGALSSSTADKICLEAQNAFKYNECVFNAFAE